MMGLTSKQRECIAPETRKIILPNGMRTLVDAADYDKFSEFNWTVYLCVNTWYVYRRVQVRPAAHPDGRYHQRFLLHREIIGALPGETVDHINRDGLDNRRANLRLCTFTLKMANGRPRRDAFRGVYRDRRKWLAKISLGHGKAQHLGMFDNPEDAARAYDAAAFLRYGEFASLNFPHGVLP